jgi:hypothetical protein
MGEVDVSGGRWRDDAGYGGLEHAEGKDDGSGRGAARRAHTRKSLIIRSGWRAGRDSC